MLFFPFFFNYLDHKVATLSCFVVSQSKKKWKTEQQSTGKAPTIDIKLMSLFIRWLRDARYCSLKEQNMHFYHSCLLDKNSISSAKWSILVLHYTSAAYWSILWTMDKAVSCIQKDIQWRKSPQAITKYSSPILCPVCESAVVKCKTRIILLY